MANFSISNTMLTQQQLKELLRYDRRTGKFFWRADRVGRGVRKPLKAGCEAGCVNTHGYLSLSLGGKAYLLHRLAWLYVYGVWPTYYLDHVNQTRVDNRITNLRDVRSGPNLHNCAKKPKGIFYDKERARWTAQIGVNNCDIALGSYKHETEAIAARQAAEKLLSKLGLGAPS